MSEQPLDGHDVIHHGGEVVAVVVPLEEYRRLKLAEKIADPEALMDAEDELALAEYRARQAAGIDHGISHEAAKRMLGIVTSVTA
jgi:PHD/YefM family antitoxin component YafN of YafNO toxin-antitoxin module